MEPGPDAGGEGSTIEWVEHLGRYELFQSEDCFPLGSDTLALGRFATVRRRWQVCDLGCGSGALGLLLLEREPSLVLTGVERDPAAADVARRTFEVNGLAVKILTGDLRDREILPAGRFDLAVSNPPWYPQGAGTSGGPARCEEYCTLDELCAVARRIVRNGGRFALVHRPERLPDLFSALEGNGFAPKRMALVQHWTDTPPSAVLLEAVRQGRPGLEVLPTIWSKRAPPAGAGSLLWRETAAGELPQGGGEAHPSPEYGSGQKNGNPLPHT